MNYVWNDVTSERQYEDISLHLRCEAECYWLEITVNADTDEVLGSLWRVIPPTFWEPADYEMLSETQYESVGWAKHELERMDAEDAQFDAMMEAKWEQFSAEIEAELEAKSNED